MYCKLQHALPAAMQEPYP